MKLSDCLGEDKHERKNEIASKEAQQEINDLLDDEKSLTPQEREKRNELDRKAFLKSMRKFLKNLPSKYPKNK